MVRDEELNRLIRYAQGMGISVRFKPYVRNSGTAAEWFDTPKPTIIIFVSPSDTKINKIIRLIHELGHHKGFVRNARKIDPEVEAALEQEDPKKAARRKIYLDELADYEHWEQIYHDADCRFNIKKLHRRREYDTWVYTVWYETGEDPTEAECAIKRRQLRRKYGC